MTEEEMKAQQEASAQQGVPVVAGQSETPESAPQEAPSAPSPRDKFREEYSGNYPDEDLSNDDAYVNHLKSRLAERDGYEKSFNNLTDAIGKSPLFADMVEAAKGDPNFNPIVYAVESGQLDLEALQSDPDYSKKLASAQQKALERKAKQKTMDDECAKNFHPSIDMINRVGEELGLDEEQKKQAISMMYQIMDDLLVNKVDENTFRTIAQGMTAEDNAENARQEGYSQGMAKNVTDKLRRMPQQSERDGGRQTAQTEQTPTPNKRESNMFGI